MASALSMLKRNGIGAGGVLAKGAIGYTTSHFLAKHCHGKKDTGKVPAVVAGIGKGVAALGRLFLGDTHGILGAGLGAADAVGQAGVDFLGVVSGLRAARTEKGVRPILIPATADVKALPAGSIHDAALVGNEGHSYGEEVTLGALGQAQPGKSLTRDQIRELRAMH